MLGDRDWFTEIKQLMDGTSRSYFETIINLIKWNTALAVGAILWFGSYIVNTSKPLNWILTLTASVSLLCLVLSIAISIGVFYSVSRFFKEYWLLWSKYGKRDLEMGGASDTILDLVSYYANIPKVAKSFDFFTYLQIILLASGLGFFTGFILLYKQIYP